MNQKGIKIPEEISLIGYDDIFFSELLDVPLTTVHQPVYDMGVEAVRQLALKWKAKEVPENVLHFNRCL